MSLRLATTHLVPVLFLTLLSPTHAEESLTDTVAAANARNNRPPGWLVIRYDCVQYTAVHPEPNAATAFDRTVRFYDGLKAANPRVPTLRELAWNPVEGKWKLDVEDRRDLKPILAAHGLSENQGFYLSASLSLLRGPGLYTAQLSPAPRGRLLIIDRLSEPKLMQPPFSIGAFSEKLISNAGSVDLTKSADGTIKIVLHAADGVPSLVTIQLDPALEYRYTRWQHYQSGRLVREIRASQYKPVGTCMLPFHQEDRRWEADGELAEEMIIDVKEVSTQPPATPLALEVPPDSDVLSSDRKMSQTGRARTVTLDSLPGFVPPTR